MTLQELKNDPRSTNRAIQASILALENNLTGIPAIFRSIDLAYSTGKHRSPSYIKARKKGIIKLLIKHKLIEE